MFEGDEHLVSKRPWSTSIRGSSIDTQHPTRHLVRMWSNKLPPAGRGQLDKQIQGTRPDRLIVETTTARGKT